jgi:hypothetical protein
MPEFGAGDERFLSAQNFRNGPDGRSGVLDGWGK